MGLATKDGPTADPAGPPVASGNYRLDRLRIRHVRLLEVIHRRGSLGAAAKELGLSQPAVSLMLRELETVFGATLVERDVRGGRLTQQGLHLIERFEVALSSLGRSMEGVHTASGQPPLRLGCTQVVGVQVLPRALAWMEAHDGIAPMVVTEAETLALLTDLVAGTLDCVIAWVDESVASSFTLQRFDMTPLWRGRMQVVASVRHPLARLPQVSVEALRTASWLLPRPASRTYAAFLKLFVQHGVDAPPATVECANIHSAMQMVAASSLLAVTPDTVARHYSQLGLVTALKGRAIALGDTHASLIALKENRGLSAIQRLRAALLASAEPGSGVHRTRPRVRPVRKLKS